MAEPTNYASMRRRFDPDIAPGKRVALAPHLDLWMAGVRYGTCTKIEPSTKTGEDIYLIEYEHGKTVWLAADDLLGALH